MSNLKGRILFLVCVLMPFYAFTQTIIGQVKNVSNKPLSNVSVVVYESNNIIAYSYTDINGKYQINIDRSNSTQLKIKANILGYKPQEKIVQLQKETINLDFLLEEHIESLNEVVLEAWEKINVKKDTITVKVSAFKNGSERVVEDLLKNIPGIEVSNDGNIKINGKNIDKLLIEGDDLFDDKYKLLTKNLDANTIEDIQILNNFEDNPVLKSFQESEKVALNLRLKDDKKNILFGNIDTGFGTNEQYDNSLNLGLLNREIKFFNLAKLNNIGITAASQVKNPRNITINGIKTEKRIEKSNNDIVNIDNLTSSNFSKNEDIFNSSLLNSLSFTTNVFNNIKLRSLSYVAIDDINKQHNSFTDYFIDPETITFTENNDISTKGIVFSTELEFKHLAKNSVYYTYNFAFENDMAKKKRRFNFKQQLYKTTSRR